MAKTKPACRYAAWIDFRTGPAGCEKTCTASLLSKPFSLLGKFPGFEGNRETREIPKCGSGASRNPQSSQGRIRHAQGATSHVTCLDCGFRRIGRVGQ